MDVATLSLKSLERISPSQYSALKRCPYRVFLANTYDQPLLPYPPHGHLGNVIHECIRLILSKKVKNEDEFNKIWNELIEKEEAVLKERGFEFLTPLRKSVKRGYAIKKLQVKALLNRPRSVSSDSSKGDVTFMHEQWLSDKDKLIAGRADLIIETKNYSKITDFKSGRILEEEGEIKEDYEDQMKLYAYLYNAERGQFPNELTLVDMVQKEYPIEFTAEECKSIANEAKDLLRLTNEQAELNQLEKLANPSAKNCGFCLYRPACKYHWELEEDSSIPFANVRGELVDIRRFNNGNISATLRASDYDIVISHLHGSTEEELESKMNSVVALYNVLKSDEPTRYRALRTTKIYEA